MEIRASYEAGRMLGSGEVIGRLQMSWDELLDHGDEPFDLSFPPVRDVHPSLTLKAAVVYACDDQVSALSDSLVDSEIARDTDAGHARFAEYAMSGMVSHLNDALQHFQLVLDQCPVGHPDHATALTNLAYACLEGYNGNHLQDIDTTTSLIRKVLALRPQGHPDHASSLHDLITALNRRCIRESTTVYIHESVQLCCKLLPLCPEGTYIRSIVVDSTINNIPIDASDEGIHLRRNMLELCPMGQQLRPRALDRLAWALFTRFIQRGDIDDIDESVHLRREAVYLCPEGHSDRAGYLHHLALSLGRGQQWSLASRLKTPVADLESANPTLAHNYLELSKRVSNAAQGSASITDRAAADRAATEYRGLTRQWGIVIAEIRNIRSFSRFLLPPSYEDLQAAARQGPVIILIASKYSCSAIIVPTSGDLHHVTLPSVSLTELNNLKDRFARAIRHASIMGPKVPRNDLIVLLRTVWDAIMLPIVNVLENVLELKHRSRIWLCPTAAFTSIPIHAAHPFQTKADGSKEPCLEDLYICSYTPTLSVLVRSRQMMKRRVAPSFATIGQGQPGAGKGKALLGVDSELELVHKLVPATATRTTVSGDAATRAGALQALEENAWVHLACHGKQDPTQPYNSHFVMRDEHLTLLDIMDKDIPHAEFAFLSACHTAVGDEETPDEVIHLAAGVQFSGFKRVIGTLWEVNDAVAKHVVEALYKYMFMDLKDGAGVVMDCTRAAWALNRATHAVKTKVPLEQRMVFVHIGV
ncbi:CHAT domain-containing protein [Suillus americanus]|nr:CHAT domain-containing protein [Suillus americanus]